MTDETIHPDDSHVFPTDDLQEHVLVGPGCPCRPRVELEGAHLIYVHNAFDRREIAQQRFDNYRWN